jgi:uncharacterized protein (DUF2062 family)
VKSRILDWFHKLMPKREQLEHNRWVRPFASRPELWRLTRRSVPRGVAVGLLVGIFALIPGVQAVGAALMCVPCRGNIPLAITTTFLSNPATTPFILMISLYIGNNLGFHADLHAFTSMIDHHASLGEWVVWLVSDAAPSLILGLLVLATVLAAIGYVASSYFWRGRVARRRRQRLRQRENRLTAAE